MPSSRHDVYITPPDPERPENLRVSPGTVAVSPGSGNIWFRNLAEVRVTILFADGPFTVTKGRGRPALQVDLAPLESAVVAVDWSQAESRAYTYRVEESSGQKALGNSEPRIIIDL